MAALADPSLLDSPEVQASLYSAPPEPVEPTAAIVQPPTQPPVAPVAEAPEPAGEQPLAEVPADPAAAEQPEAHPDDPIIDPVTQKPILPNRIRTKQFSDLDQRAIALQAEFKASGINITLRDACERVEAMFSPAQPEFEQETAPAAPAGSAPQLQTDIAALEAKIRKAGEENSLFTPELASAQIELAGKYAQLAQTKAAEGSKHTVTQAQLESAREANLQQALAIYPNADNQSHPLGAYVAAKVRQIDGDPNHPQRTLLEGPDATSKIIAASVAEFRQSLQAQGIDSASIAKIIGAKGSAPVPPASQPARAVPRTAPVAAPGAAAAAPVQAITHQQALQMAVENPNLIDSPEVQAAIYGGGDSAGFLFGR